MRQITGLRFLVLIGVCAVPMTAQELQKAKPEIATAGTLRPDGVPVEGLLDVGADRLTDDWFYNLFKFNWGGKGRLDIQVRSDTRSSADNLLVAVLQPDLRLVYVGQPRKLQSSVRESDKKKWADVGSDLKIRLRPLRDEKNASPAGVYYLYVFQKSSAAGQAPVQPKFPNFKVRFIHQPRARFLFPWAWGWREVGRVAKSGSCLALKDFKLSSDALKKKWLPKEIPFEVAKRILDELYDNFCPEGKPPAGGGPVWDPSEWPLILLGSRTLPSNNALTATLRTGEWFPRMAQDSVIVSDKRFAGEGQYYQVWRLEPENSSAVRVHMEAVQAASFKPEVLGLDSAWKPLLRRRQPSNEKSFVADVDLAGHDAPIYFLASTALVEEKGKYELDTTKKVLLKASQTRMEIVDLILDVVASMLTSERPEKARWRGWTLSDLLDSLEDGSITVGVSSNPNTTSGKGEVETLTQNPFEGRGSTWRRVMGSGSETSTGAVIRRTRDISLLADPNNLSELEAAVGELRRNIKGSTYVGDVLSQIRSILLERAAPPTN